MLRFDFRDFFKSPLNWILIILTFLCGLVLLLGVTSKADELDEGSISDYAFTINGSETVIDPIISDFFDTDGSSYTWSNFLGDLSSSIVDLYFAVSPGTTDSLVNDLKSYLLGSDWLLDTSNGMLRPADKDQFMTDLDAIYKRLGYHQGSGNIAYWIPLPFESGNYRVKSDYPVYYTVCTGSGGSRVLYALRDTSGSVICQYVASQSSTTYNLNSNYTGSYYSGVYRQGSSTGFDNAIKSYFSDNLLDLYSNNDISVAQASALSDFFGDIDPSGGLVWDGNLFFDDNYKDIRINNVPGSSVSQSQLKYHYFITNNYDDSTDISNFFGPNINIIYTPDYTVPLWFSVDPDPSETREYQPESFEAPVLSPVSVDNDTSFFTSVYNALPGNLYSIVLAGLTIWVASFIIQRK